MNSFYQSALFRTFGSFHRFMEFQKNRFYILFLVFGDEENDIYSEVSIYSSNSMSVAFTKMFEISKNLKESSRKGYCVSLWQRNRDGGYHRVGFSEDVESLELNVHDNICYHDYWDYVFSGKLNALKEKYLMEIQSLT